MINMFDLTGKVAVVTGAGSGIGADAAVAYAECGAKVALLDKIAEGIDKTKERINAVGGTAIGIQCDVRNEERVRETIDIILKKFNHIDILLNNAGVSVPGGVDNMTAEEWDESFDTNVKGIFLVSKYVVPQMKKRRYGKIVNIASVNSIIADKSDFFVRHSYNASKSAVLGLTKGMAATYAKYGITVNAIGPALFKTGMTEDTLFKSMEFLKSYNSIVPAGRPGKDGELNGTILYFSSDASSYVQGQFLAVDGGFTIV